MDAMSQQAKEKIDRLTQLVQYHNHRYFILNDPEISDAEYDKMFSVLQELESKWPEYVHTDSPTKTIGGLDDRSVNTIIHMNRMYGLDNVFSTAELIKWIESKDPQHIEELYVDLKMDGMAIKIRYKDGKIFEGGTRGDGTKGEDITHHVIRMADVPKKIKWTDDHEVYGEAVLTLKDFHNINGLRRQEGERSYANQRNAVAGIINSDASPYINKVKFRVYGSNRDGYLNHDEMISDLQSEGFVAAQGVSAKSDDIVDILEYHKTYNDLAESDMPADGTVIRFNRMAFQKELGYTDRCPRFARAWKFDESVKKTKILEIFYQVGRTGVITPMARVAPINLDGVNVTKATLHNETYIRDKKLAVGNMVSIKRAGGVIPAITGTLSRTVDSIDYVPIKECPICGTPVVKKGNVAKACPNLTCTGILSARLEYFVGKNGLDIQGIGKKIIEKFVTDGVFQKLADVFLVDQKTWESYLGEKKAETICTNIAVTISEMSMADVIRSVGIPGFDSGSRAMLLKIVDNIAEFIAYGKSPKRLKEAGIKNAATAALFTYIVGGGEQELLEITAFNGAIN